MNASYMPLRNTEGLCWVLETWPLEMLKGAHPDSYVACAYSAS